MQKLNNWITQPIDQVDLAKKVVKCTVCIVFFTIAKQFKHTKQIMELCEKIKGNDKTFCDN